MPLCRSEVTSLNTCTQAEGLVGDERATHPFARVSIGANVLHSAVIWQSTAPMWDEKLAFK